MRKATHIYHNGAIVTMDSRCSTVRALAAADDTILAVGALDEISGLADAATRMIDLDGATMLPGLYDAHSHFMRAGLYSCFYVDLASPPVGTAKNIADITARIRQRAETTPPGEWILCSYYDETAIEEQRHLTLAELDTAAPDHPLFLRHVSGHIAACNSLALKLGGITRDTPQPAGGRIRRDANGNPNGVLEEPAAMNKIQCLWPDPSPEQWRAAVIRSAAMYTAKGVTTAQEGGVTDDIWDAYFAAHAEGILKNRVQLLPRYPVFDMRRMPQTKTGEFLTADGMLSAGAVKLFQDGSIQGYTGSLSIPYHRIIDESLPGGSLWRGYSIFPPHELAETVLRFHKEDRQIAVHGNGDQAIGEILDAFEAAQRAYPRADARHIIIHCQTAREDQLDRIKRLGVVPSFFVVHTYYWGDRHNAIFLGPERAKRINPLKSALNRGIVFSNHNDTHVTPIDPLLSVWSAVNRRTSSGAVLGGEQRIDPVSALRSVTTWAAYQYGEERIKGSLEPGKLADMTVLAENPLTVDPQRIKDIEIVATVVGNRVVHGNL